MSRRKTISPRLIERRLAELGKIKIGGLGEQRRTADGSRTWRLPEKYDHFLITGRERDEDGSLVRDDAVHAVVGQAPTELDLRLLFDEPAANFQSEMVQYKGRSKVWECDGEEAKNLESGRTGKCQHPDCNCKPYGRLSVMLEAAPTVGGFYVFRTTSWESVRNIQSTLELLHEQFGFLAGLPLTLRLYPAEVSYEQGGKTRTGTAWKVALVLRGTLEEARQLAAQAYQARLSSSEELKLLAAAHEEELEEREKLEEPEIADEYFPDANAVASVETASTVDRIKRGKGITGPEAKTGRPLARTGESEAESSGPETDRTSDVAAGADERSSAEEFFTEKERAVAEEASSPGEEDAAEEPHYTCTGCGATFGSPQALGGHKAHCQGSLEEEAEEADGLPLDRESLLELGFRYAGALSKKPGFFSDRARELFPEKASASGVLKVSELGLRELRDVVLSLQTEAEATLPEEAVDQGALL